MKKFFKFTLFVFSFVPFLQLSAQDLNAAEIERCWGLNFMWQRDFTVGKQTIDKFNYDQSTPEDESVTGFGLDWYINPKSSLSLLGSIGIGSDKTENSLGSQEFSGTEIGAKLSYNYYPYGMKNPVYFSLGPWTSYISYSETQTNTPLIGTETKDEYSASRFGVGVNVTGYIKPWKDLDWEFSAGYNLGAFWTPENKYTQTFDGQTTETKGPSSFHFQDCGGFVGTRLFFTSQNSF